MSNNVAIKNDVVEVYILNEKISITSFQKSISKQNTQNKLNHFFYERTHTYIVFICIYKYKIHLY